MKKLNGDKVTEECFLSDIMYTKTKVNIQRIAKVACNHEHMRMYVNASATEKIRSILEVLSELLRTVDKQKNKK